MVNLTRNFSCEKISFHDFDSLGVKDKEDYIRLLIMNSERVCIDYIKRSKGLNKALCAIAYLRFDMKPIASRYKGSDQLVSLLISLKLNKLKDAKKSLFSYYHYYGLESPEILLENKLKVGCRMGKYKKTCSGELVSVVMTAFNAEEHIENAIDSILNQSWENLEIIVVNDGSTDGTSKILESFQKYRFIKILTLGLNVGTYASKNVGLSHASGTFVTFQDADDWSHPLRIEKQVKELIKDPFLIASLSKFYRIDIESGLPHSNYIYPLHRLNSSSLTIRLKDLKALGNFYDSERTGADSYIIDLIIKLHGENSVKFMQEPLSIGSYRKGSLTGLNQSLELSGKAPDIRLRQRKRYQNKIANAYSELAIRSKRIFENNSLNVYFIGFSPWKNFMKKIFKDHETTFLPRRLSYIRFKLLYSKIFSLSGNFLVFSWGYKLPRFAIKYFKKIGKKVYFVEDGFIRSIGLGSSKEPPLSITVDSSAVHFDAKKKSDLESILSSYDFRKDTKLMNRAKSNIETIVKYGISKYNCYSKVDVNELEISSFKKNILIVAQVQSDDSIKYGSDGSVSNESLLALAIKENPGANIFYKPHIDLREPLNPNKYNDCCTFLECDYPVLDLLHNIDHVYTITSLLGFECLIRGIKVTTLGCPFYSGWGLTDDRYKNFRRVRELSVEEVFAGAYILYPIYLNPRNFEISSIEEVLNYLIKKLN